MESDGYHVRFDKFVARLFGERRGRTISEIIEDRIYQHTGVEPEESESYIHGTILVSLGILGLTAITYMRRKDEKQV